MVFAPMPGAGLQAARLAQCRRVAGLLDEEGPFFGSPYDSVMQSGDRSSGNNLLMAWADRYTLVA